MTVASMMDGNTSNVGVLVTFKGEHPIGVFPMTPESLHMCATIGVDIEPGRFITVAEHDELVSRASAYEQAAS